MDDVRTIYIGLDDTDVWDSPGTNQLAKQLARDLADVGSCRLILRHQLWFDPAVPYTSKNGSASLSFHVDPTTSWSTLRSRWLPKIVDRVSRDAANGSDPGICLAEPTQVDTSIIEFARRCQRELVTKEMAFELAAERGIFLEGLAGTRDGVIGALAAVALAHEGDDGRAVLIDNDDSAHGYHSIASLAQRAIEVRCGETDRVIDTGIVDVGKHLRPNRRGGRLILFVQPDTSTTHSPHGTAWQAVKRP